MGIQDLFDAVLDGLSCRIPFREKILWSGISLFVFLVCCQIPLYGISANKSTERGFMRRSARNTWFSSQNELFRIPKGWSKWCQWPCGHVIFF